MEQQIPFLCSRLQMAAPWEHQSASARLAQNLSPKICRDALQDLHQVMGGVQFPTAMGCLTSLLWGGDSHGRVICLMRGGRNIKALTINCIIKGKAFSSWAPSILMQSLFRPRKLSEKAPRNKRSVSVPSGFLAPFGSYLLCSGMDRARCGPRHAS